MTRQLGLLETRRLLRNPYLCAVVVATLGLLVWAQRNQLPNLSEVTVTAALATSLIAATLMVVANLAALRDQREGVPETLAALPGQASVRTRAILLASGLLGAALTGAVIGAHLLIRSAQGPAAGDVDVREILAAVAATAILAALGVALGRWVPTAIAAPAVFAVMVIGFCTGPLFLLAWFLPVTAPYELQAFGRPAGWRLLYLGAVLVLLAALAMLRHGRRPLWLAVAAAAVAAVVPAGIGMAAAAPPMGGLVQSGEPSPGDPDRECVERNRVTYCHLPGFEPWIPFWERAAGPVLSAVPPDERHRLPAIVQSTETSPPAVAGEGRVLVGMTWGRGGAEVADRTRLAGAIAGLTTGLADPGRTFDYDEQPWCDGRGQARTVVTLWLAGQAAPLLAADTEVGWSGGSQESYLGNVEYGERELGYARLLLDRPQTRELVGQHWDRLLDPDTTIEAALPLLGLPAQSGAEPLSGRPCD
jgi:hypothetical protein